MKHGLNDPIANSRIRDLPFSSVDLGYKAEEEWTELVSPRSNAPFDRREVLWQLALKPRHAQAVPPGAMATWIAFDGRDACCRWAGGCGPRSGVS